MEFKIMKNKVARLNVTFLNIIKKIYSPCLVSVVLLAYFVVLGVFQGFDAAFYRRSQGWTLLFRMTWIPRPFSPRNCNPPLDFSFQRKEG